jgi:hypothetical protein
MSEMDKHMDDAFRKMSEDFKVTYNDSYWETAKAKLDDANLDDAFRVAASAMEVSPAFDGADIDDMFMDAAFVDAASEVSATYDAAYFDEFMSQQGDLIMDEAFNDAANSVSVDYMPHFWNDADVALQNEGLHYEYDTAYWKEAKRLLDRSDRRIFFTRWTSVAVALLLISFGGQQWMSTQLEPVNGFELSDHTNEMPIEVAENVLQLDVKTKELKLDNDRPIVAVSEITQSAVAHEMGHNSADQTSHSNLAEGIVDTDDINESTTVPDPNAFVIEPNYNVVENVDNKQTISSPSLLNKEDTQVETKGDLEGENLNNIISPLIKKINNNNPILAPRVKIEKIKPRTVHSLNVIGGVGLGNKWGAFSYLPTIRSAAGVEYMVSSSERFKHLEFGGSLMLNHVKQNNLGFEDRTTEYNAFGGVSKHSRAVMFKNLIYGNANLLMNHRIAPKHKMKFGVGIEYLLAANSNMSYIDGKVNEVTIVNDNWGVREGLNNFDVRLMVGYEYQISNAFALQFTTNYGVFDRTDDFYLKSDEKNVELGVMLGLKYNIFNTVR